MDTLPAVSGMYDSDTFYCALIAMSPFAIAQCKQSLRPCLQATFFLKKYDQLLFDEKTWEKILVKSENFVSPEKWEPCVVLRVLIKLFIVTDMKFVIERKSVRKMCNGLCTLHGTWTRERDGYNRKQ